MSQQQKHIFFDNGLIHFKWFDQISSKHQLALFFLYFLSDNVGIWDPNIRQLEYHLKGDFDPEEFLKEINQEKTVVKVLDDGRWWVLDYLRLQAKTLTPNNRAHVSYIEDLIRHDLLVEYAANYPNNVNYHEVYVLEKWEDIEDNSERKKQKKNFKYIENKGLVRVLKEACETLDSLSQGSKDKDKEEEADTGEAMAQEQPLTPNYNNGSKKKNNGKPTSTNGFDVNDPEIFGKPSLQNKAPF